MKKTAYFIVLVSFILNGILTAQIQNTANLMPVPQETEWMSGKVRIDTTFMIAVSGPESDRLYSYSTRILQRLAGRTGLFLTQPVINAESTDPDAVMQVSINRKGKLVLHEDEAYSLIAGNGKISLNAETDIGALRGLETFLQLLEADSSGYFIPAVKIKDAPRFAWRGLMIDACRHFMPVDVVKRNLDGMAAVKLNVLHWHLSEDQGFRVECKTFPKLHELGSDGLYYTQAQIRDIIQYADNRGIRVIPEFDLPGHATSWFVGYPEYASAPGPYKIERRWGVFDPTFNPANKKTYEFLDKFFKEMAALFPDEYMHIGGDENNGKQWNANKDIQAFMKKNNIPDNHSLQAYFNQQLLKIITKYGKKMVGWEEIMHKNMPKNIVTQSWAGEESMVKSAKMGFQTILSRGYYIDLIQPTDFHYLNDPLPDDLPLNDEEKKLILGGEATMWAEFVSPETVDSRIWPRTAAIAERFWSSGNVRDVADMYRRLDIISFHLEELGLLHIKNRPMMLRRLTNHNDFSALLNMIEVVEPVKIYRRNRLREQFQQSPLTRVVDVATPDAAVARKFRELVNQFVESGNTDALKASEIETWLKLWQANHTELLKIIELSPVLEEVKPLSENLAKLSQLGLEALQMIAANEQPSEDWLTNKNQILKDAAKPQAQMEIMIVPAIQQLTSQLDK